MRCRPPPPDREFGRKTPLWIMLPTFQQPRRNPLRPTDARYIKMHMSSHDPSPGYDCEIPWGPCGKIPLGFPAHWPAAQFEPPDTSGAIADYRSALLDSLRHPVGGPALVDLAQAAKNVAIIADDPSRWTPVRDAMPVVLNLLASAGIPEQDITISLGVGRHQRVDESAMRRRLGDAVVDRYPCYSPPLDDKSHYDSFGTTQLGVPVHVFRPVAQADLRILIGSVLPHLQAGFGGGFKLIFPGCSHRSTLSALHRQGLTDREDATKLLGGDPDSNPMRLAIRQAAALLPGINLSIGHLMGAPNQVFRVATGDVDVVQSALSRDAHQRFQRPTQPHDAVVVGNFPWPGDPMMSFKVLLNHRAAVRPGGVLIGCFWTDPGELERSLPVGVLRRIAATGQLGSFAIRHGIRAADRIVSAVRHPSRFMLRWARELVADHSVLVLAPDLLNRFGRHLGPVQLFAETNSLWREAERRLHRPPRSLAVFPVGGLTFAVKSIE